MNILAALDQSPFADTVLSKAVELAKQQGAKITIMTVAEDYMALGEYLDTEKVSEKLFEGAKASAESYAAKAKTLGVAPAVEVVQGASPADLLISFAEQNGIDLIIMGHRGKKGIDRFLIGSVAGRVVSNAPCSVLVVR